MEDWRSLCWVRFLLAYVKALVSEANENSSTAGQMKLSGTTSLFAVWKSNTEIVRDSVNFCSIKQLFQIQPYSHYFNNCEPQLFHGTINYLSLGILGYTNNLAGSMITVQIYSSSIGIMPWGHYNNKCEPQLFSETKGLCIPCYSKLYR